MNRNLLVGLSVLCLVACKDKSVAPSAAPASSASAVTADNDGDDDGAEEHPGGRHGGRGPWGFCKKATDEQWAALQKCNEKLPADFKAAQDQCNTQVYGAAALTKEQACDKEKRRAAHQCMKGKNVKMERDSRKDFFQCMMGVVKSAGEGGGEAK